METPLLSSIPLLLFHIATLVFVVYSASLAYHWFTYGEKRAVSMLTLMVYLCGSAVLYIAMAVSLFSL